MRAILPIKTEHILLLHCNMRTGGQKEDKLVNNGVLSVRKDMMTTGIISEKLLLKNKSLTGGKGKISSEQAPKRGTNIIARVFISG